MSDFSTTKIVMARNTRWCPECREQIASGQQYAKEAGRWDGDFYSATMCLPCKAFADRYVQSMRGCSFLSWDEVSYTFGDIISEGAEHVGYKHAHPQPLAEVRDAVMALFDAFDQGERAYQAKESENARSARAAINARRPASVDEPPQGEDAQAAEGRSPAGAVGEAETPEPQPQAPPAVGGDEIAAKVAQLRALKEQWEQTTAPFLREDIAEEFEAAVLELATILLERFDTITALRAKVERQKTEHEIEVRTLRDLLETAYREVDKARVESEKADDEALHHKTVAADLRLKGTRQEVATVYEWKRRAEAAEATLAAEQAKGRAMEEAIRAYVSVTERFDKAELSGTALNAKDYDERYQARAALAALAPTAAESTGGAK